MLKPTICHVLSGIILLLCSWGALAQEPSRGGTLNAIVQPEPPILMLGLNQQGPTQYVAGKIYESLLTYDFDLEPQPSLAKSWTISEDGLTYTFELNDGIRWHDGELFSAADVVFSADVFLRETHPRLRVTLERVESITAPDDSTVIFQLAEPFGPFIYSFEVGTMPILPKHIYEGSDYNTNPANQTPIGTGPFRFEEWQKGSYIHLVRNEEYWQEGKPYLDEIYFRVIPDSASRALAYETGEVDVLRGGDVANFDVPRLQALPDTEMTTQGWEFFAPLAWMQMNLREYPFDDVRFRQAVMYAMDREFVRDNIWFGLGRIATGPVNSVTTFYEADVPRYPYDMAKAQSLVEEMGLEPDTTISLMPLPYGETWQRWAEYTKQQLEQLGVSVEIAATDAGGWSQRLSEWDFDLTYNFLYQYADPALGVARNYISANIVKGTPFANNGGYSNPRVDELFAEAATANTVAERQQLYSEAQKILAEEVPIAWQIELEYPTFYRTNINNLVTTAIGLNETFADVYMVAE